MQKFKIKDRVIGQGYPCYVIAEMSANHGGSFEKAMEILRAAKKAGADAVKLQTYTPDTMTIDCGNEYFQLDHPLWKGKTLYQLYKEAQTPWEWHKLLKEEAEKIGLHFFSTPYDETAVDFLETLDVPAYKIASFELVDDILLRRVAKTCKPVIMSTGMATLAEIQHAVKVLRKNGTRHLALLRCVSAYPARPEEMNLAVIKDLSKRFDVVAGFSDHTADSVTAVAAVVLGAAVVEKHIKLADGDISADAVFSLSAQRFLDMVRDIRLAEKAVGFAACGATCNESAGLCFRRSIFVVKDMAAGDIFSLDNLRVIRPGQGLSPSELGRVLGRTARVAVSRGTPLNMGMVR
jgi:pseudaminic acid synthase